MPTQDQPSQATTANPVPKTGNPVLTGDSSPSISEEPQAEPILVTQSPVATEVAERPRFQSLAPPDIPHPYNSLGQTDTALEGREPFSDGGAIASKQSVPFPMPGLARPPASGSASAGLPFAVAPDHHVAADTHDRILADTDSPAIARRPDVNRSAESTVPVGWHFMVVGMISLTAVLIAGSILWTMGSQAVAASRSRLLQPTSAVLDAVINKSIRVVEEPLAMPTEIQLHGQACRPTLVRVDAAHTATTPQPHFTPVVAEERVERILRADASAATDALPANSTHMPKVMPKVLPVGHTQQSRESVASAAERQPKPPSPQGPIQTGQFKIDQPHAGPGPQNSSVLASSADERPRTGRRNPLDRALSQLVVRSATEESSKGQP